MRDRLELFLPKPRGERPFWEGLRRDLERDFFLGVVLLLGDLDFISLLSFELDCSLETFLLGAMITKYGREKRISTFQNQRGMTLHRSI